ncbi:probable Bax inhibitor 1 [Limanda limanda]|uniref:probable Bax inhibitor 1 n=1 Tax=Limanda limanda TaxID=27771 RepID=UPI0029C68141|nr:probable Bax inhibitor 1 [Limanda limanda]
MYVFDRNIDVESISKFFQISHSTLKEVCLGLAVFMFVTGAGSYVHVFTSIFQGGLLPLLGSLGMMLWLDTTPHHTKTDKKRLAIFAGVALFLGVGLGPTTDFVIAIHPIIIVMAFLWTSVIFVCFTFSALYAKRRSYLFLGGTLISGLSLLFLLSMMNVFYGAVMMFKAHMYLGLIIMCGFVQSDTQPIEEEAESGDHDCVWHCVDLFMAVITSVRKVMAILNLDQEDKKTEKKSNPTLKEVCFSLAWALFSTGAGFYGYVILQILQVTRPSSYLHRLILIINTSCATGGSS